MVARWRSLCRAGALLVAEGETDGERFLNWLDGLGHASEGEGDMNEVKRILRGTTKAFFESTRLHAVHLFSFFLIMATLFLRVTKDNIVRLDGKTGEELLEIIALYFSLQDFFPSTNL